MATLLDDLPGPHVNTRDAFLGRLRDLRADWAGLSLRALEQRSGLTVRAARDCRWRPCRTRSVASARSTSGSSRRTSRPASWPVTLRPNRSLMWSQPGVTPGGSYRTSRRPHRPVRGRRPPRRGSGAVEGTTVPVPRTAGAPAHGRPVDTESPPAGAARPGWSRKRWLVLGAVTITLLGGGTAAARLIRDHPAGAAAPAPHPVLQQGTVTDLVDKKGIDFDTGVIDVDNAPGQDLSPFGAGSSLGAMELPVHFSLLAQRGPMEYQRCAELPLTVWTRDVKILYHVPPGQNICVQTDQGRLSMFTPSISHPARPGRH